MKYLGQPQSGSQAGTTASHNRAGQYLRSRRAPVSPTRTPKQGIARARFGSASALWQSMSSELQAAWTAFAHSYPVVDALGQTIVLTGQQYFVGINSQLQAVGSPQSTAIPTNTTIPAIDTPVIYADASGSVIASVASAVESDFNKLSISSMKSNGVSFNKQFSFFGILTAEDLVIDVSAAYSAQYGMPVLGKKIFANFVEVNSSGMKGNDTIISCPVLAAPVAMAPVLTNPTAGNVVSTGPGVGTDEVVFFVKAPTDQYAVGSAPVAQVAGVATTTIIPAGFYVFSRTLIGGVYGVASNTILTT